MQPPDADRTADEQQNERLTTNEQRRAKDQNEAADRESHLHRLSSADCGTRHRVKQSGRE